MPSMVLNRAAGLVAHQHSQPVSKMQDMAGLISRVESQDTPSMLLTHLIPRKFMRRTRRWNMRRRSKSACRSKYYATGRIYLQSRELVSGGKADSHAASRRLSRVDHACA